MIAELEMGGPMESFEQPMDLAMLETIVCNIEKCSRNPRGMRSGTKHFSNMETTSTETAILLKDVLGDFENL